MDVPKPTPRPKNDLGKKVISRPRSNKVKSSKVVWEAILPTSKKVVVRAVTELEAVEIVSKKYGTLPDKVTKKKREHVLKDHLTHKPFANLDSLIKGV